MADNVYDFSVENIDGQTVPLAKFRGKVLLIVNVASECGFTPQYAGLQDLYAKYRDQGFEILAFPCNQFGGQEPGSADEIKRFCVMNFKTTFPLFAKIDVNGGNADPLFVYLREQAKGLLGSTAIKWNFTKFLVDHQGAVLKRFGPRDPPTKIAPAVRKELSRKAKEAKRAAAAATKAAKTSKNNSSRIDTKKIEIDVSDT